MSEEFWLTLAGMVLSTIVSIVAAIWGCNHIRDRRRRMRGEPTKTPNNPFNPKAKK